MACLSYCLTSIDVESKCVTSLIHCPTQTHLQPTYRSRPHAPIPYPQRNSSTPLDPLRPDPLYSSSPPCSLRSRSHARPDARTMQQSFCCREDPRTGKIAILKPNFLASSFVHSGDLPPVTQLANIGQFCWQLCEGLSHFFVGSHAFEESDIGTCCVREG